jgi:hypothetical protein
LVFLALEVVVNVADVHARPLGELGDTPSVKPLSPAGTREGAMSSPTGLALSTVHRPSTRTPVAKQQTEIHVPRAFPSENADEP